MRVKCKLIKMLKNEIVLIENYNSQTIEERMEEDELYQGLFDLEFN